MEDFGRFIKREKFNAQPNSKTNKSKSQNATSVFLIYSIH